jgi:hypothetical protein
MKKIGGSSLYKDIGNLPKGYLPYAYNYLRDATVAGNDHVKIRIICLD